MKNPLPLCACGCGQPVKTRRNIRLQKCIKEEAETHGQAKRIERSKRGHKAFQQKIQINADFEESQNAKQKIRNARYRKRHREKINAKQNEAYRTGRKSPPTKEYNKQRAQKRRERLTDCYVRSAMALRKDQVPPEAIELKRQIIILNRFIKKTKQP